jgi:hypothetical protein
LHTGLAEYRPDVALTYCVTLPNVRAQNIESDEVAARAIVHAGNRARDVVAKNQY